MEIVLPKEGELGAEIRGVDVAKASQATVDAIKAAVHEHSMIYLRGQRPSLKEYLEFGRKLGTPMVYPDSRYHHPEEPEVFVTSNVKGKTMGMARSGYFWHTDLQFKTKPQALTVLHPQTLHIPNNRTRDTLFVNMAHVYERLPAHLRKLVDGRMAEHDPSLRYKVEHTDVEARLDIGEILDRVRKTYPAPKHPCVITHPVTKRRALYMSDGFTTSIVGLSYEENKAALAEIFAFTTQPKHVHTYQWQQDDIMMWDNRMLIHRAGDTREGEQSMIFRIGLDDRVPFYEGIAA